MGSYEPRRAAEMAWTVAAVEGHPPSSCPSWNTPRSSVNTGHFEPSHGATAIEDVLASIESTRPPEGRLCSALLQASRDVGTRVVPANRVDLRVRLHPRLRIPSRSTPGSGAAWRAAHTLLEDFNDRFFWVVAAGF